MSTLLVAVAGALVTGGLLALVAGLAARPVPPARPRRSSARRARMSLRTRMLAGVGLGIGGLVAVLTGLHDAGHQLLNRPDRVGRVRGGDGPRP